MGLALRLKGYPTLPRSWSYPEFLQVINQFIPVIAGSLIMGSTVLVDQAMAAMLGSGQLSALSFGNKVPALIGGILSIGIGTAIFSGILTSGRAKRLGRAQTDSARADPPDPRDHVYLIGILMWFSTPIAALLFQRGAFTAADSHLVGGVQACLLLQVPFFVLSIIQVRLISSLKSNYVLLWGTLINVSSNILLNYIFMKWLGVAGIALSTACVYLISFLFLARATASRLNFEIRSEGQVPGG